MNVQKLITTTQTVDLDITGITLLSEDEYELYVKRIPPIHETWWMRSAGLHDTEADVVMPDGTFLRYGFYVDFIFGVRPVLNIEVKFPVGTKFDVKGYTWTVIAPDMAICDKIVDRYWFKKDLTAERPNWYETSDIKTFVEGWWAS